MNTIGTHDSRCWAIRNDRDFRASRRHSGEHGENASEKKKIKKKKKSEAIGVVKALPLVRVVDGG